MKPFLAPLRLLLGAVSSSVPANAAPADARPPNILIFYVDDMGWAQPGSTAAAWRRPRTGTRGRENALSRVTPFEIKGAATHRLESVSR